VRPAAEFLWPTVSTDGLKLRANAVVGVTGFFDKKDKRLQSIGIQCAFCHSTVMIRLRGVLGDGSTTGRIAIWMSAKSGRMRIMLCHHVRVVGKDLFRYLLPFCYQNIQIQAQPAQQRLHRFFVFLFRYILLGLLSLFSGTSLNQRAGLPASGSC